MDEVQRVGNVNAVELRAYERIADVFARLLAEPTPEALLGAFADAIEQLVPSSGLVLLERNEAEDELTPVLMRGTRNDDALRVPLVAHGRVTGALSIHREGDDSEFRDEELEFIARFADAAALVLDNARARARLAQLAQTDDLTGALNRRGFFEAAERELARATREDTHTALLVVDVDDLKGVNDRHGHSLGDALLAQVAETLSSRTRRGDIVGRLGGDEFAVVLPGAGRDAAENLAHELEHLLRNAVIETLSGRIVATASVGVAATDGRRMGVVRLLARADVDMYRRKKRRKSSR
jgi:diguanylate cyclase (GGDEF)-like protein